MPYIVLRVCTGKMRSKQSRKQGYIQELEWGEACYIIGYFVILGDLAE